MQGVMTFEFTDTTPWRQAANLESVHYGSYYGRSVQYRTALFYTCRRKELLRLKPDAGGAAGRGELIFPTRIIAEREEI